MRLLTTSIVLSIYLFLGCSKILAQNTPSYNVKHYDVFDGLSNNWISDIFQDKDGFIWLGTQYGLNRFDGQKFKIFTYVPGDSTALRANWVRSVTQLDDHHIYVGTLGGGVTVLNPYTETFNKLSISSDTTNSNVAIVNNLVKDNRDNLWISSAVGAFRYRPKDKTLQKFYNKGTTNISSATDGTTLILGRLKQENYQVKSDSIIKIPSLEDEKILNLFSIARDSTLVYTQDKLLLLHRSGTNWIQQELNFETTYSSRVRERPFIFKDNKEWIWVNGGKKIYKFSPDFSQQNVTDLKELLNFNSSKNLKANSILQDKEDNYWIGTNVGVFQLIQHKPLRHPLIGNMGKVREIEECGDKVWFALSDGIYMWNKNTNTLPKKINEYTVASIKCASDGFLYTLTRHEGEQKLLKINPVTQKEEFISFTNVDFSLGVSWKTIEDMNQRLWIAQWDNIIVFDIKDQSYFTIPVFKENTGIIELYPDQHDNVWVGSIGKGLLKFSKASTITSENEYKYKQFLHKIDDQNTITSNLIQAIHQSSDHTLWVGTDGGLNRLDIKTEKFQRFLRADDMPNDKILNITSDQNGVIWLSTVSHGILSYNPETKKFNNYIVEDGLYDNSMVLSSVYQDKEGFIWMSSEGGVQYFHPEQLNTTETNSPNLVWMSVTKYRSDTVAVQKFPDKNTLIEPTVKIHPEDQSVGFQFQALTFEKPEKLKYQFKLKGYHQDWLPIQENGVLTLSYLPKGSYQLLVKASLEDQWENQYNPISVIVIPPWYKTNLAYIIYGLLILYLIYSGYRIQLRRKIAETEKEFISDLSKAKTRWFHQIAHEFRTPLTVIIGAIDQIRDRFITKTNTKTDKHLSQIEDQVHHLSNQVHKILEIAQMQENQLEVQYDHGDFIGFQKYLFYSFTSLAEKEKISLHFSSSHEELYMSFDEDKWRKITTNIVSNAIKYNITGGNVLLSIRYDEAKENLIVQIEDTGEGISEEFSSILFDPFTKEKTYDTKGVGLGLTLTKELVQLMNGQIAVASQKGKGTTFTVKMPVTISKNELETEYNDVEVFKESDKPLIVIAEDHKEVREYIHFCLSSEFEILQADNGYKAWKLCEKHLPDLVISDVMMPEWDGIKLGTRMREHMATNHIPLILLTAKSSHSNQIEGLKIGADAYLTKPFDRKELIIRVENLIKTRKQLQEKYQKGDITASSENKEIDSFMQSIIEVVHSQMDNDEFGVPQLAEHFHISRVHLFRKIKNVTGMPPSKLIRKIRLEHAKKLVENNEFSIAEIAYQTGFKDPAYFTRVYVEEFNKTPSESRNKSS